MQPHDSTLPAHAEELIPLLLPEEIQKVTEELNKQIAGNKGIASRIDVVRPVTAYFSDGRWLADRLGQPPVDLYQIAYFYIRKAALPRLKAERLALQRKVILLCRANMTDDEFVDWAIEVIPLLIRGMPD